MNAPTRIAIVVVLVGCSSTTTPDNDSGVDSGVSAVDARLDTGAADAAPLDAATNDGTTTDTAAEAGTHDSGTLDTSVADTAVTDANRPDGDAGVSCSGAAAVIWTGDDTLAETGGRYPLTIRDGTIGYADGVRGRAFSFPAAGAGYLEAANVPGGFFDGFGSEITVEAWLYLSAAPSSARIFDKLTAGVFDGPILDIYPSQWRAYLGPGGPAGGTTGIPTATWTHVAATYDGRTTKIFQNGTMVASVSGGGSGRVPVNGFSIRIGSDRVGANRLSNALVDDVQVHCRVLSDAEIAAHATP